MIVAVAAVAALASREQHAPIEQIDFSDLELRRILQHSPLPPPPPDSTNRVADNPAAVALGKRLFFDPRLSSTGTVSCATCHDPALGFADGHPLAQGLEETSRNSPGLWNLAYNRWFFWDGRADTLWSQALHPVESPEEMGSSRMALAKLIHQDPSLRDEYQAIFGTLPPLDQHDRFPPNARIKPTPSDTVDHRAWAAMREDDQFAISHIYANLGKAIAAYERKLISRDSPFDRFVAALRDGDTTGGQHLSASALRGLQLFVGKANCRLCHSGTNFTDGEFHNTGVPPRAGGLPRDNGRFGGVTFLKSDDFNSTGPHSDDPDGPIAARTRSLANTPDNWGRFKTPGLRNVALTAPYMHEGQLATLEEVIRFYSTLEGAVQLDHHREQILQPLNLTQAESADLAEFLRSLTDAELPPELLQTPTPNKQPAE